MFRDLNSDQNTIKYPAVGIFLQKSTKQLKFRGLLPLYLCLEMSSDFRELDGFQTEQIL